MGFPGGSVVKNPPVNAGDASLVLWSEISWRRKWQPISVFYLGNPMDRGAWWATVHGVANSWTQLSNRTHTTSIEVSLEKPLTDFFPRRQVPMRVELEQVHSYFKRSVYLTC